MKTLDNLAPYEEKTLDPYTLDHHQSEINGLKTQATIASYKEAGVDLEMLQREHAGINRIALDELRAKRDPNIKIPNPMQSILGTTGQSASTLTAIARHKAEDEAAKARI